MRTAFTASSSTVDNQWVGRSCGSISIVLSCTRPYIAAAGGFAKPCQVRRGDRPNLQTRLSVATTPLHCSAVQCSPVPRRAGVPQSRTLRCDRHCCTDSSA
jgi:hypothetical protein